MSNYKLVPVEPAPKMLQVWKSMYGYSRYDKYKAMLAEAPVINIVATKNEQGQIVSVTLQDADHRILEVIAEADVQGEPVSLRQRLFNGWEGCSNHGCVVVDPKPGMMRTNGSCQCVVNASRSQLHMLQGHIQSVLHAATQPSEQQPAPDVTVLLEALEQIERWDGFPSTNKTWEGSGEPVSYGAAFGSNGERDFMRGVARAALAAHRKGGKS